MHTGVRVHHRVYGTLGLIGGAQLRYIGTTDRFNRGNQTGGRGEGGFRVSGRAATDRAVSWRSSASSTPIPPSTGTATFASVGMRLLSR